MTIIESLAIFYFLSWIGCGIVLRSIYSYEELKNKHTEIIWLMVIPMANFIVVGMWFIAAILGMIWKIKRSVRKYLYVKYWTYILSEHIKFCILSVYTDGEEKFRDEQVEKMEQIIKIAKK